SSVNVPAGASPTALAIGDWNKDGKTDLAVANNATFGGVSSISVLVNKGNRVFDLDTTLTAGLGPSSIVGADLNGDGTLDLAVCNERSDSVSVFLNDGGGDFPQVRHFPVGAGPKGLAAADLDGDHDIDLGIAISLGGEVEELLNEG